MFIVRRAAACCFLTSHHEFGQALDAWAAKATPGERRAEAAQLIRNCFEYQHHTLSLAGHGLTSLPDCLGDLACLRTLLLADNRLRALPPPVTQLRVLERLDLSGNLIESLGDEIQSLGALKKLCLDRNPLRRLPDTLCQMRNLANLSVQDAGLVELPPRLGDLLSLADLSLSGNALESLPPSMTELVSLRDLNLSHNQLRYLPTGFELLEFSIPNINLKHNRLLPSPPERWFEHPTLGEGFKKWVEWLHDTRDYKTTETRVLLASRLEFLFGEMAKSRSFRHHCMAIACEAAGHCGDRPAWGLNQMNMALENRLAERGLLSEEALFKSARSQYRLALISEAAQAHIMRFSPARMRELDAIEVDLAFQTGLRDTLALPLTVRSMDGFAGTLLSNQAITAVGRRILDTEQQCLALADKLISGASLAVLTRDHTTSLPPRDQFKMQPLAFSVANYPPWMAHVARRDRALEAHFKECIYRFEEGTDTGNEWTGKVQRDTLMFLYHHGLAYAAAVRHLRDVQDSRAPMATR